MLVAALSAGQKTGLAVVAGAFIVFAVAAAYVIPARWPNFPGSAGLRPFLAATGAIFVGMMLGVWFLAREKEEEAAAGEPAPAGGAHAVAVREVDYKIELPSTSLEAGEYTFTVRNAGKDRHNFVVEGPGVADKKTPILAPGKTARLEVRLERGSYELYCSVPGHKQLGMDVKLEVT